MSPESPAVSPSIPSTEAAQQGIRSIITNIKTVIFADTRMLEHLIAAKIAGGHVMLADSHGVGKTSLAKALAGSIAFEEKEKARDGLEVEPYSRIQCTVDLLPQDILGYSRLSTAGAALTFVQGPIFAHFVLCDEINLLTPKTQGSFFQAMEERSVTIEGRTFRLPDPFFIIATMNLKGVHLFPLPAPQLDRFMVQLSLGYPEADTEARIIEKHGRDDAWKDFTPVVFYRQLLSWQRLVDEVEIHPDVIRYIVACLQLTRKHPAVLTGASPRTGVKLSRLARALALSRGMGYVTLDLVKEIFLPAVAHRLILNDSARSAESVLKEILDSVAVEKPLRLPSRGG